MTNLYYCEKCNRFTDVRFLHDKTGTRYKSYCYKCGDEMLVAVTEENFKELNERDDEK